MAEFLILSRFPQCATCPLARKIANEETGDEVSIGCKRISKESPVVHVVIKRKEADLIYPKAAPSGECPVLTENPNTSFPLQSDYVELIF